MFDPTALLTDINKAPLQAFDWGTLQWLCNGEILPGAVQTIGICHLHPGRRNPLHYHPNCEEILFIQQGSGKHLLDSVWVSVQPGSVVRVPAGMKHQLSNEGAQIMISIVVFSSADRQTVFLE
jgi:oxalate decarboxylase/phosphoglucose isomerase-like protein (cupin superfamily)